MAHLLIVEDDPLVLKTFVRALRGAHTCATACNGAEALDSLRWTTGSEALLPFDLILSDIDMPLMTGLELYRWVARNYPCQVHKVAFYTGSDISGLTGLGVPIIRKGLGLEQTLAQISGCLRRGVAPMREVASL